MDNTNYKVCDICGNLVDNNNIINIHDKELCKTCLEKRLEEKEHFSPLATFVCSLIPGIAHIYLGKKQKGIFLLTSFIISLFLFPITFLLIFIIYIYSITNANFSRKYIENNIYIEDLVDKFVYKIFSKKNKKYLEEKIIDKRLQ